MSLKIANSRRVAKSRPVCVGLKAQLHVLMTLIEGFILIIRIKMSINSREHFRCLQRYIDFVTTIYHYHLTMGVGFHDSGI